MGTGSSSTPACCRCQGLKTETIVKDALSPRLAKAPTEDPPKEDEAGPTPAWPPLTEETKAAEITESLKTAAAEVEGKATQPMPLTASVEEKAKDVPCSPKEAKAVEAKAEAKAVDAKATEPLAAGDLPPKKMGGEANDKIIEKVQEKEVAKPAPVIAAAPTPSAEVTAEAKPKKDRDPASATASPTVSREAAPAKAKSETKAKAAPAPVVKPAEKIQIQNDKGWEDLSVEQSKQIRDHVNGGGKGKFVIKEKGAMYVVDWTDRDNATHTNSKAAKTRRLRIV
eukprot:TRINITY_DN24902_c0_g1_i1.p1 TRINITY_DN24902_c0_g1~~TRINITY_DN24902_c0_g1_i1.p1  ORF type:complete len:303 (-),score=74.90 TRINITY_DN24902_c0_g1_i1:62-910(-)